jgi:hypothetical protein
MSQLQTRTKFQLAGLLMLATLAVAVASDIWLPSAPNPPLPILRGDTWSYFKGTAEPSAAWNIAGFDDTAWLSGASGIGYGDNDDATVLADMRNAYTTVYMRRLFDVASPAAITGLELRADYDDGFVAYLNGVEVARRNVPAGFRPFDSLASASHEASGGTSGNPPETIPLSPSSLVAGTNVLAVQAINVTLASTDLTTIFELRAVNAPPDAPASPSPADGASNVPLNPTLCVDISDPDSSPLTAGFTGREVTGNVGPDFTIIALPDTQYYSASFPATYQAQTQWIVDNRVSRNIVFVTQLGDCADNATINQQYVNADAAWDTIEANPFAGQPFGLPYGIAVGNHDQAPNADPGTLADEGATTGAFNTWFGVPRFTGRGYYAGHYGSNNDNHYELFSASGMDFIALHLEFMPSDTPLRQAVLAWADGVLKAYPNRRAMLTTHYLLETGTSTAFGNQGQAIYDALKGNPNLFLMLAGHLDQASRRSDTFNGHTIHTLKSDYQTRPNGGDGWLRIMTFSPANNTIQVQTWSPTLNQFINNHADNVAGTAQNEFTLSYDMAGGSPFVALGSDTRPSGGTACVAWPGRQPGRQYEWSVAVGDGTATTTGPRYTFTTALSCTLDSDCADGNLCNGVETCSGGGCHPGTAPGCGDADACTTDACDPAIGCTHTPVSCDDGDACTIDTCDAISGCVHQAVTCPQGEVCTPASGICAEPSTACVTAAECTDGDACTVDTCTGANVSALSFDGSDDFVTMGVAPGLGSPEFTIETWFKRTGAGIGNTTSGENGIASLVPLVAKGAPEADGSNLDANYILGLNGNFLAADFEDTAGGENHPVTAATTPIVNGTWYHAAATYDGTTWRLYLDGNLEETLAVGAFTPRADSVQPFGIGAMLTSTGTRLGAFQGLIDEVRVWNRALSQAEIQAGRDLEIASGTGLLGRWGLNENGGATAGDSVGPTAENGTLTNGPAWSAADRAPLASGLCAHTPAPGCVPCNGDEECLDTNVCNGAETCSAGICQPGTPLSCDDGDACTTDSCDAADGCEHAVVSCDDGVACTADSCSPALGCAHVSTCAPGSSCDLATGQCQDHCAVAGDCDDGSACTTDVCNGGNAAALNFGGLSDYVSMGAAAGEGALGARAFTLEAWIRRDGASWGGTTGTGTGGVTAVPIVTKGRGEAENSNVDANYFLGITAAGRPVADFEQFAAAGGWSAGQNHPACSSATIADQAWHHVAVTYSAASGWHFYVDGVEGTAPDGTACTTCDPAGSCPQSPGVEPRYDSIQHFGLGTAMTSNGTAAGFFGGVMDEARVWSRVLGQAEIAASKDLPLTGGAGLLGRWGFDDATANDSTAPAENGTLFGAPAFTAADKPPLQAGTCGHTAVVCDDADLCTTDSCNPATGCVFAPVACSDGDVCNGTETCNPADGQCVAGTPLSCDDGSVCTLDTCSGGACQHAAANQGGACDDGSACTTGDACNNGVCAGSADPSVCDDGNACSLDACSAGPSQGGLAFDGSNDFVDMGAAAELGSARFTVETWFKKTGDGIGNTTGSNGIASLVPLVTRGAPEAEGSNVDANYILGLNGNFLAADFEDTLNGGNHPITATTTPIVNDVWYHAAATYDGTTWRLYLNGNLEATSVVGLFTPRADSIQHAALGAMVTSTGTRLGAFQGVLDEARIWNLARSQAEIQSGMARRFTSMPGLLGRYGLDEGAGTTAFDSTSPASNGALTNFTLPGPWIAGAPGLGQVLCSSGFLPDGTSCPDEGNACTANACSAGACAATYAPSPGCCVDDLQCDDGNSTTVDTCVAASCDNAAPVACTAAAQCDDANACSLDACVGNMSALNFNGTSDFVTMGAAAGENALGARAFTLEAWIRRDGASWGATTNTGTGGVTGVPLVTKGRGEAENSNVDANYFFGITATGRPVGDFEQFAAGGGWAAGQNHPACSSASISDQNWHHVAVTYSTTAGWHFYIDGVEGTTADGTACTTCSPAGSCPQNPGVEPRYDSVQHFGLGTAMTSAGTSGAAGFFGGVMDEVRVWNRSLTAAEIQAGRTQEIATATNLIGRWSLNENGGTVATDTTTTPTQTNGSFAGAPAWSAADRAPIVPPVCQHAPGNAGALCRGAANSCDVAETCNGGSAFCPADLKQPNGTTCTDGDVCTLSDACQEGACTGTAAPRPAEVTDVQFDPDTQTITWTPIAGAALPVTYDVTRGLMTEPPSGGAPGSVCVANASSPAEATDATVPAAGEAFWYLVRGRDVCHTGTWGYHADNGVQGAERLVDACP